MTGTFASTGAARTNVRYVPFTHVTRPLTRQARAQEEIYPTSLRTESASSAAAALE